MHKIEIYVDNQELKEWPAYQKWSFEYFKSNYGHVQVTVSNSNFNENYVVSLSDYIEYIMNSAHEDEDILYLRDWDYTDTAPELANDILEPKMATNLLKGINTEIYKDISWIYIGPKKAITPLHQDFLHTHTWNALITGRKEWIIYDVKDTEYLYNGQVDPLNPDHERFPEFKKATPIKIIQNPGDIIYLPSDYWHLVRSIEPSIAITKNYINETNIGDFVESILKEVK